jgi:peptidoglycan-associated lipoprotein
MKQRSLAVLLMVSAGLLAGCASVGSGPTVEDRVGDDAGAGAATGQDGAAASGAQMGGQFQGNPLDDPASPLSKRVFYFDFDSSELSETDRQALIAHGQYLAANPAVSVVVEGHADERGSREYNLALGERRAQAGERILLLQAAGKNQLQVISFGEERPVAMGHDDGSWRLNRRVELLYSGY